MIGLGLGLWQAALRPPIPPDPGGTIAAIGPETVIGPTTVIQGA